MRTHCSYTFFFDRFASLSQRMQLSVRQSLTRCFQSSNPDLSRVIGIPIRGSDKCYRTVVEEGVEVRHGEANCVTLDETMALAKRVHAAQPWIDTVLVTSEEKHVIKQAHRLKGKQLNNDPNLHWNVLTNNEDIQQGTGKSTIFADDAGNEHKATELKPANVTESILKTLACQALPAHHIVLLRSSKYSVHGQDLEEKFMLGFWLSLPAGNLQTYLK